MPASRKASSPAADGQLGDAVERGHTIGGDAEFFFQVEAPPRPASLMTSATSLMVSKRGVAVVALHQARDVLVEHGMAETRWG